jgi:hypothetical protein
MIKIIVKTSKKDSLLIFTPPDRSSGVPVGVFFDDRPTGREDARLDFYNYLYNSISQNTSSGHT